MITCGNGADKLDGGLGVDWLYGDAGNDILYFGGYADHYDRGTGTDTLSFEKKTSGWTLNEITSHDIENAGGSLANIEKVVGSNYADTIRMDVGTLDGAGGNDQLFGGAASNNLNGGSGIDALYGGDGAPAKNEFDEHQLIMAAIGCSVAWGVIDATLYVLGSLFYRSQRAHFFRTLKRAHSETEALATVQEEFGLEDEPLAIHPEDRARLYQAILALRRNLPMRGASLRPRRASGRSWSISEGSSQLDLA